VTSRLDLELARLGASALVVFGADGGESDLAPFVGGARLGESLVVARSGAAPRLAYLTPMERSEAAATGLALLTPEELGLPEIGRRGLRGGARLAAILEAAFDRSGVAPARVALAGAWSAGELVDACARLSAAGWSFVSAAASLRRVRKQKSELELASIRRTAAATCDLFRSVARRLATAGIHDGELVADGEPLTVGRLRRELAVEVAEAELDQPRSAILAPAEEGGVPHAAGSPERILRIGESLVVDIFPKERLFADCTRTFCVGEAPEPLARAHADVLAALERAHREVRPGRRGWELQLGVCELLAERGWPTPVDSPGSVRGYVHGLGHGVGYELHELPSFGEGAEPEDGTIEPGDVLTLEPGLYEPGPGGFGVRLEDLVAVGPAAAENLTPLPYTLDPRAW
jgi:Xaa-Pro aminopeptidase